MPIENAKLCIVAALHCEIKPLIKSLPFSKVRDASFDTYASKEQSIICVISGVGKLRMAAAIGYCYARYQLRQTQFINIGIAGAEQLAVGSLYEINKITDIASNRHYYPDIFADKTLTSSPIQTHDSVVTQYPAECLVDLESSGFYLSANKFVDREQIRLLKVVSDNASTLHTEINAPFVSTLVEAKLVDINNYLQKMLSRTTEIRQNQNIDTSVIETICHFTTYQQHELASLMRRWQANFRDRCLQHEVQHYHRAKDILIHIEDALQSKEYLWDA